MQRLMLYREGWVIARKQLCGPEWLDVQEVLQEQEKDEYVQSIVQALKEQPDSRMGFEIQGAVVLQGPCGTGRGFSLDSAVASRIS